MDKTSTGKNIVRPTAFEVDGLKSICKNLDCTMSELIDAIMSNTVAEEISVQICYDKNGCHPSQL